MQVHVERDPRVWDHGALAAVDVGSERLRAWLRRYGIDGRRVDVLVGPGAHHLDGVARVWVRVRVDVARERLSADATGPLAPGAILAGFAGLRRRLEEHAFLAIDPARWRPLSRVRRDDDVREATLDRVLRLGLGALHDLAEHELRRAARAPNRPLLTWPDPASVVDRVIADARPTADLDPMAIVLGLANAVRDEVAVAVDAVRHAPRDDVPRLETTTSPTRVEDAQPDRVRALTLSLAPPPLSLDIDSAMPYPASIVGPVRNQRTLASALFRLPEDLRAPFVETEVDAWSIDAAAALWSWPASVVLARVVDATDRLAELLDIAREPTVEVYRQLGRQRAKRFT